jgi:PAS domain S-box-containing protein
MSSNIPAHQRQETSDSSDYFKDLGEKTQLIIDAALDAIIGINTEGLITLWNPQAEVTFGWKKEEIIGQSLTEKIVPLQYRNKHDAGFKHYVKTGEQKVLNQKLEISAIDRAGREFPIEISILPIKDKGHEFFCAFIRDISERKKAEQQIRESEEKFKSLVQNSSDIIGIYDSTGSCRYISPNILEILGYEPTQYVQLDINNNYKLIHPDDLKYVAIEISNFAVGMKTKVGPYRMKHKNGEWRWMESSVTNLFTHPIIQGLVINSSDITERVHLQQELHRKTLQNQKEVTTAVINAQEMERSQIGQELHDNVNQVLTTVKLYNEMLLDGIGNATEIVEKSVYHLQNCINEIRSISKRLSAPTLGNITLQESIRELVESINLTKRINIVYTFEGQLLEHTSQEIHLGIYRIVQEQLNNIIKYAEASYVAITVIKEIEQLSLIIQDDGKGFDVHTKRDGIGITNMKTRAENLNGSFLLWSQPGKGCKVQVNIPL